MSKELDGESEYWRQKRGDGTPVGVCLKRGRGRSDAASALADPERHGSQNHHITETSKHGSIIAGRGASLSFHPSKQPIKQLVPTTDFPLDVEPDSPRTMRESTILETLSCLDDQVAPPGWRCLCP